MLPVNQLTLLGWAGIVVTGVGVTGTGVTGGLGFKGSNSRFNSVFSSAVRSARGGLIRPPAIPINSPQYFTAGTGSAPLYLFTVLVHQVSDSSLMRLRWVS